jgi:predicted nucleic acid-binding protein
MEFASVKAILDTSMLIASWKPLPGDEYAISIVSLAEMHFGVLRASGTPALAARVRRLSEVEREFDPIPVDGRVARSYAECAEAAVRAGRSLRRFDLVIAATARVEGAKLYTLNLDDFTGLEDLVEVVKPL